MATIVQQPAQTSDSSSGMLIGLVLLILFILAIWFIGAPLFRNMSRGPSVNVPDKVDVNVNSGQQPSQ